jgi:1-pyrroline-5-carboxylate dehydrogenase
MSYVTLQDDHSIDEKFEKAVQSVKKEFGKSHPFFIGGEEVYSSADEFQVKSPVDTRIIIGSFQKATREHVRKAIEIAQGAFGAWADTDYTERVRIFRKVASLLEERIFSLAAILAYEAGKRSNEGIGEVSETIAFIHYYCDLLESNHGYSTPMGQGAPSERCVSVMRPYGVWAVISPFNAPIVLGNNMAGGALMTGNTVILKPTSEGPLASLALYKIYREAGVPANVVHYITASGDTIGDEITANPNIAGIAFTGSKAVGLALYRNFVQKQAWPKPFVSETGSKNPCIVAEDADLDKAALGVARSAFGYTGQKCSATSRVYVHESVEGQFVQKLVEKTREMKVGNPADKSVVVGPLINRRALDNFVKYVEMAKAAGGKVETGGQTITAGDFQFGYFAEPTVITGIPHAHQLFIDELFVPLVVVSKYSDLAEALTRANKTEYGLTAGIFTRDTKKIDAFFKDIQFGVCYANRSGGATTGAWPGAQPFVGWKGSGCTGKGAGGPYYLLTFLREQAQTLVEG